MITYLSDKSYIAYLLFVFLYIMFLGYDIQSTNKDINKKVKNDLRFKPYHSNELYNLFGKKEYKFFNKKIFTSYNSVYSQMVYFKFLLSDLDKIETLKFYEDLKFKTKNYVPFTEKSSFSGFIALTISLFILGLDKKILPLIKTFTEGIYLLMGTIGLFFFIILILYDFISFFERKTKKQKEVLDLLEYILNREKLQ